MREIKFRVWDKTQNQFWDRDKNKGLLNVSLSFDGKALFWTGDECRIESKIWPEEWVIQQFTGVKDSLGREIYEGDIMASRGNFICNEGCDENGNYPDIKAVIVWNEQSTRFCLKRVSDYLNHLKNPPKPEFDYPIVAKITCFKEIIGNIFENPELLDSDEIN